jgi:hypothetical protein
VEAVRLVVLRNSEGSQLEHGAALDFGNRQKEETSGRIARRRYSTEKLRGKSRMKRDEQQEFDRA